MRIGRRTSRKRSQKRIKHRTRLRPAASRVWFPQRRTRPFIVGQRARRFAARAAGHLDQPRGRRRARHRNRRPGGGVEPFRHAAPSRARHRRRDRRHHRHAARSLVASGEQHRRTHRRRRLHQHAHHQPPLAVGVRQPPTHLLVPPPQTHGDGGLSVRNLKAWVRGRVGRFGDVGLSVRPEPSARSV